MYCLACHNGSVQSLAIDTCAWILLLLLYFITEQGTLITVCLSFYCFYPHTHVFLIKRLHGLWQQ